MSRCPGNPNSQRNRKEEGQNCKASCPGRKNRPAPEIVRIPCDTICTQTQPSVIRVTSCIPSTCCSGPIVIEAPTDQNGHKTDLRIELYIHQSTDKCMNESDQERRSSGPRGSSKRYSKSRENYASGSENENIMEGKDGGRGSVEEEFGVVRTGQLENAPPTRKQYANGPGSDIGPNQFGKVNASTDTEEDVANESSSEESMIDVATQVSGRSS